MESDTITPGTSFAFTKTGFDTILLTVAARTAVTPNITGEVCVTPRYPVS
ncbi:S-Ena type endospore appendage [Paenibacillus elgii]